MKETMMKLPTDKKVKQASLKPRQFYLYHRNSLLWMTQCTARIVPTWIMPNRDRYSYVFQTNRDALKQEIIWAATSQPGRI